MIRRDVLRANLLPERMTAAQYRAQEVRKKRDNPEHRLQVAVAEYLDHALKPPTAWTALDAGAGKMSKASAGMRKARGVKSGWPDILVMHPGGHYRTLVVGIELKAAKGDLSGAQADLVTQFLSCNAHMWVCRSVDDVEHILRSVGIRLHASAGRAA